MMNRVYLAFGAAVVVSLATMGACSVEVTDDLGAGGGTYDGGNGPGGGDGPDGGAGVGAAGGGGECFNCYDFISEADVLFEDVCDESQALVDALTACICGDGNAAGKCVTECECEGAGGAGQGGAGDGGAGQGGAGGSGVDACAACMTTQCGPAYNACTADGL